MTATQVEPALELELGGKKRTLQFTLNTFIEVEELTGMDMMQQETWDNVTLKMVRTFLWVAFKQDEPELIQEEVGSWITIFNMEDVFTKFEKALELAMPKGDKGGNGSNPPTNRAQRRRMRS